MQEPKFIRNLQIGEYVTPPDPRGIDQHTGYAELTIDENHLWCKRTRNLDVLAGWAAEPLEDGVLAVLVNPLMVKLSGVESVIGAEVVIRPILVYKMGCAEALETHIHCPICRIKDTPTDLSTNVFCEFEKRGPFPMKCAECNSVFNISAIDDRGNIKAVIGTEVDKDVLIKRSEKRLERLKATNAPAAMIDAEVESLKRLRGERDG